MRKNLAKNSIFSNSFFFSSNSWPFSVQLVELKYQMPFTRWIARSASFSLGTLEISTVIFIFEVIIFWNNQNWLFANIFLVTLTEISHLWKLEIFWNFLLAKISRLKTLKFCEFLSSQKVLWQKFHGIKCSKVYLNLH